MRTRRNGTLFTSNSFSKPCGSSGSERDANHKVPTANFSFERYQTWTFSN